MVKRQRIGLLLGAPNIVLEPDFYRVVPPEVTIHTERMWFPAQKGGPGEDLRNMNKDIARATRYLASMDPDLIVYGCTSGSFLEGIGHEKEIVSIIQKEIDVHAVTTTSACVEAIRQMGIQRVSVATPYGDYINERLRLFFEVAGFELINVVGEPSVKNERSAVSIGNQDPQVILNFALSVVQPKADGVFLPCTAWRAIEVVEELERRLGIPVVTANQATIWHALRYMDISTPIHGPGILLRSIAPISTEERA